MHATGQYTVRLRHENASCRLLWRRIVFGLNGRLFAGSSGLCLRGPRSIVPEELGSSQSWGLGARSRLIVSHSGITIDANKENALCW
jgi:hypothetical protein